MFRQIAATFALAALLGGAAAAETHEVRMLNRGTDGTMVFEPAFLRAAPGDTVRFLSTDRGHNAETIDGMVPDGAAPFAGAINEELEVVLTEQGVYGVMCKPHFAMGMVMTIAVGAADAPPDGFLAGRMPRKAAERFAAQLDQL